MGGLVSAIAAGHSFVLQGPYEYQLTVDVNSNTQFTSGWNINHLAAPAIVGVQGSFQADGRLTATNVEVITTTGLSALQSSGSTPLVAAVAADPPQTQSFRSHPKRNEHGRLRRRPFSFAARRLSKSTL